MRKNLKNAVMLTAFALLLSLVAIPDAEACTRPVDEIYILYPDGTFICYISYNLMPISDREVVVSIGGYETVGHVTGAAATVEEMNACAIAQSATGPVSQITHAGLYNSLNGELIYAFDNDPSMRRDFTELASEEGFATRRWYSFYTDQLPEHVEDGIPAHFTFVVKLKRGYTVTDLARALESQGVFATSAANLDHTLNPHHFSVMSAQSANVLFPAVEAPTAAVQGQ